ncbi:hypothetical protein [Azospirillum largimobile]
METLMFSDFRVWMLGTPNTRDDVYFRLGMASIWCPKFEVEENTVARKKAVETEATSVAKKCK